MATTSIVCQLQLHLQCGTCDRAMSRRVHKLVVVHVTAAPVVVTHTPVLSHVRVFTVIDVLSEYPTISMHWLSLAHKWCIMTCNKKFHVGSLLAVSCKLVDQSEPAVHGFRTQERCHKQQHVINTWHYVSSGFNNHLIPFQCHQAWQAPFWDWSAKSEMVSSLLG